MPERATIDEMIERLVERFLRLAEESGMTREELVETLETHLDRRRREQFVPVCVTTVDGKPLGREEAKALCDHINKEADLTPKPKRGE